MTDNTGWCELCPGPVPTSELVQHIAVHHPDQYEAFETWPDGGVVVIDESIEPHEFGETR